MILGFDFGALSPVANAVVVFTILFAIFFPLETWFRAHRQGMFRKEWGTDLLFFLGQHLLWTAPVVFALVWIHSHLDFGPLTGVRTWVAGLPFWLQFLLAIGLCDICIYWAHRWSHRHPFLWRFHKVHHTAERLDWVAAYREHPFDNLYTRFVENFPAILLGFPLEAIAGFAMFRGLWALYIHSNVDLTPGPLRYLLGSSRLHHWHHEWTKGGYCNFANLSPLTDLMFGTFFDPGHMPNRYGIDDPCSHHYVRQLVDPLLPAQGQAALDQVFGKRETVQNSGFDPDSGAVPTTTLARSVPSSEPDRTLDAPA